MGSLLAAAGLLVAVPARAEDAGLRTVLFGSLEAGASVFSTNGVKLVFDRFERDGPVSLLSAGTGARLEGGGGAPLVLRNTALGAALGGYQFVRDWGVVTMLAGPEGSAEMLTGGDGTRMLPFRAGLRLHGEVWARPSEATLLTATAILGSARGDAWGRLSWGYAFAGTYFGPEASLYADCTGYRKWAFGLHATDWALGGYRFRLSAGLQVEREAGPYLAFAVWHPL